MFVITKRIEIAGAHKLNLPYESPCSRLHGHNWIITIEISAEELNKEGMVIDFTVINRIVRELDHQNLNDLLGFNPTAENIASYFYTRLEKEIYTFGEGIKHPRVNRFINVTKVTVQESEGNIACYIP